jgi:uncharacterized protein (DUF2062 family)
MKERANRPHRSFLDLFRLETLRRYVRRALRENDTPERLSAAIAVGFFGGMMPFPGHSIVSVGIAMAFKLNVLTAVVGTWLHFPLLMPITYGAAFYLGKAITGASLPAFDASRIGETAYWWDLIGSYSVPLFVGTTIVGIVGGFASYFVTLHFARLVTKTPDATEAPATESKETDS